MIVAYKLAPCAKHPQQAYDSPGIDLFAAETAMIQPGGTRAVSVGVSFVIPEGHVGILKDRSSLALNGAVLTVGGVIDPDYRGVVKAIIHNRANYTLTILEGEKLVQMLVVPVPKVELEFTNDLPATERGDQAFGSSNAGGTK